MCLWDQSLPRPQRKGYLQGFQIEMHILEAIFVALSSGSKHSYQKLSYFYENYPVFRWCKQQWNYNGK